MSKFKQNLKVHLGYYLHFYVIIPILVFFIVNYLVNIKIAYKENEEITIYIASYFTDDKAITNYLYDRIGDGILNINILSYNIEDSYFGTTLNSVAVTNTDIIIIPEVYATEKLVVPYFAKLNSFFIDEEKVYAIGGNVYGIEIYNKSNKENELCAMIGFNTHETNHEKYFMFVNKDTVNFNSVVPTNNKENSNHIEEVIKAFLG